MEVPKHLVPPEELQQMLDRLQPQYVPISRPPQGYANDPFPPADPATGKLLLCCMQPAHLTSTQF